jgi:hypothetical protein
VPPPAAAGGAGGAPAGAHPTQPPAGYPAQFTPPAGAAANGSNAVLGELYTAVSWMGVGAGCE